MSATHAATSRGFQVFRRALGVVALAVGTTCLTVGVVARAQGPEPRLTIQNPMKAGFNCVKYAADGKALASSTAAEVILWDAESGQQTASLQAERVADLEFSPDGKTLATGGFGIPLMLWDVPTKALRATLRAGTGSIRSLDYGDGGKILATGRADGTVRIWDIASGKLRHTFQGHEGTVNSVSLSPDSKTLASGGHDKTVRLWDTTTGQQKDQIKAHEAFVTAVVFSPNGKVLVSANDGGQLKLWDVASRKAMTTLRSSLPAGITDLDYSSDGALLAASRRDGIVTLREGTTGAIRARFRAHEADVKLDFSPDGKTLVTTSSDGTIKLWDVATILSEAAVEAPAPASEPKPAASER